MAAERLLAGRSAAVSPPPPSGHQYEISKGDQRATIVEVGGAVREYVVGGRPILDPFAIDEIGDGAHGAVLVPWPNRLADGAYRFDEVDYQVALTEPDKRNAIHGFSVSHSFGAAEHASDRITMEAVFRPTTGYPFHLDVKVDYVLGDSGLTVTTTASNVGDKTCPYGCGQHPYLSPGYGLIDDCVLWFDADTRIVTDAERQLPTGTQATRGSSFDFSDGRRLADVRLDDAFTDVARDDSGKAWVRLDCPDGHRVELWVDRNYPIVELFTGDSLEPEHRRRGLGVEPMSCPPNALQTGELLMRLEPGASVSTSWGVRLD